MAMSLCENINSGADGADYLGNPRGGLVWQRPETAVIGTIRILLMYHIYPIHSGTIIPLVRTQGSPPDTRGKLKPSKHDKTLDLSIRPSTRSNRTSGMTYAFFRLTTRPLSAVAVLLCVPRYNVVSVTRFLDYCTVLHCTVGLHTWEI